MARNRKDAPARWDLDRWLRLEAENASEPGLGSRDEAIESSLAEALRALPVLGPKAGFARRVAAALDLAPWAPALSRRARRKFRWWERLVVATSLGLAGSAWLTAKVWTPWLGVWLRPGELIDGASFMLREGTLVLVRGLSTWRALAEVREVLLRVLTTPDAAAAVTGAALAAFIAFHALRGVLVSERSAYRV